MKRGPHFLPPLQSVVYAYTRRLLDETATNANSFAMDVADRYLATVAPDVRSVPFKLGEGDALIKAMKDNGQVLRRYMDGTVKVLPADLLDAWVMALPEPYRSDCERDLAKRRGRCSFPLPETLTAPECAGIGVLLREVGDLCGAWGAALADGQVCDREVREIHEKSDGVIAALLALRRYAAERRTPQGDDDAR